MPLVNDADYATVVALSFIKRYYYFVQPKAAKKTDGMWEVKVDVAVVGEKVASIQIDADTGQIIAYEFPIPPEKR